MTQSSIFEPDGRAVPFIDEGEGPVALVLLSARGLEGDGLGVIAHYLAEEAGFRVVRVAPRPASGDSSPEERAADAVAVLDHIGLADAWIGGHGPGGAAARAFASQHAEHVNGLLLLGVEDDETPLAPAIPVLVVQGSADEVTPPENGRRLQATAPERTSVTTIDGADHLFPLTHPIQTAVVIEEYLDWD